MFLKSIIYVQAVRKRQAPHLKCLVNVDFVGHLWEHTPPLEGRGRAVRRKVNGRVTGWNPLSLREGEGAGGETG